MLLFIKKGEKRMECYHPSIYRKSGNAQGNCWKKYLSIWINQKEGNKALFGMVIVNGSDQALSTPYESFAFTLMLKEPFPQV